MSKIFSSAEGESWAEEHSDRGGNMSKNYNYQGKR